MKKTKPPNRSVNRHASFHHTARPFRVAIYCGTFRENQDGATKSIYELIHTMRKNHIDVRVWTGFPPRSAPIPVYKVPALPLPLYSDYPFTLPARMIPRQLDDFRPNLIQISTPDLTGTAFMKYALRKGIPVSHCYHTDFPAYLKYYKLSFMTRPAWRYLRWLLNSGDLVCAPTKELMTKLQENGIHRLKIWSRGIHRDHFHPGFRSPALRASWNAPDKKIILYSGRFVGYKSLDVIVEVYRLMRKKGPFNVRFVLAGDGPTRNELQRMMPDAVFTGYLNGRALSQTYASADILLFPSTTETFGNVVQEALASGVPAVVSDEGGCKEIIQESQGGFIARAGDTEDFYRKCRQLISYEVVHRQKQHNGLAFAEQRDWDTINRDLIETYRQLVGRGKRPRRQGQPAIPGRYPSTAEYKTPV